MPRDDASVDGTAVPDVAQYLGEPGAAEGLAQEPPEWPPYTDPSYTMPDVIEVLVREEDGAVTPLQVAVEKVSTRKPFLGGYRHTKTKLLYHHATTQTKEGLDVRTGWRDPANKRHRDTQTHEYKTRSAMTMRECGTQMARSDLVMDDGGDRELAARPYFSARQMLELKRAKTLVLQCYYRGYLARKRTWAIREALYMEHLAEVEAQEMAAAAEEKRRQYELERREHPKTLKDFEILFNELEKFVSQETLAINNAGLSPNERRQRLKELLAKQGKALQAIDRLKSEASKHGHKQRVERMLRLMSQPKQWEMGNGELQEVHTPSTERASELMELYHSVMDPSLSVVAREEVLQKVKWTVTEFEGPLSRDIAELCDREAEMLGRGRKESSLQGLRQRMSNLLLQFIETPEFNPEAVRFQKVPVVPQHRQHLMSSTA